MDIIKIPIKIPKVETISAKIKSQWESGIYIWSFSPKSVEVDRAFKL